MYICILYIYIDMSLLECARQVSNFFHPSDSWTQQRLICLNSRHVNHGEPKIARVKHHWVLIQSCKGVYYVPFFI